MFWLLLHLTPSCDDQCLQTCTINCMIAIADDSSVNDNIVWCPRVTVADVDVCLLTKLSTVLDPPHVLGAHWCMLAVALGTTGKDSSSLRYQQMIVSCSRCQPGDYSIHGFHK